jgi:hypothetical protein
MGVTTLAQSRARVRANRKNGKLGGRPAVKLRKGETKTKMNLDERLEALTVRLELMLCETGAHSKQIEEHSIQIGQLLVNAKLDAENIRALARIADMHGRRRSKLEGE